MAEFPDGIVEALIPLMETIDGITQTVDRDPVPNDKNGTLGIAFLGWRSIDHEMGQGHFGSAISVYEFRLTHLIKHSNRSDGLKEQRLVARAIRSMLAHDPASKVALLPQVHTNANYTERLKRWDVGGQEFADDFIDKAFFFVSETQVTFQTETV